MYNADTTPIQRQISCNIQNNNKTCVNANIYSASLNAQISWRAATASSPTLRTLTGKYFKKKSILLLSCLLVLSSIILAIVGKIVCVKFDFLFSLFSEAFRLAQGIFFRHAKELEGKKTNRKRKIRSICKAHRGRFFEKHP